MNNTARKAILILNLMVWVPLIASAVELPYTYHESLESAQKASAGEKPILIDFYTDWCTYCKQMDTLVFTTEAAEKFFTDKVVLAKVNAEEDTVLAKRYAVSGYPTFVLTKPDGREVDRIIGFMETDEFLQTITDYRQGKGTLDDLLRRMRGNPDREMAFEIAHKYKFSGRPEQAKQWFARVIEMGQPTDSLSGTARMAEANMYYRAEQYERALGEYQKIMERFEGTKFAQNALIWTGIVHDKQGRTKRAINSFEAYIEQFPDSEDVEYAREQLNQLQEAKK